MDTIFDVGANIGQFTSHFLEVFPNASIFAFEPILSSFNKLQEDFGNQSDRIRLFNAALSDRGGSAVMSNRPLSPTNKILEGPSKPVREIEVQTLIGDEVLSNLRLGTLSYLKIDTEGHEISMLDGFHNALSNGLISFLQVETGLNPENSWHVPFEEIKRRLEDYNYRLFSMINVV